jgi:hypothetical protein
MPILAAPTLSNKKAYKARQAKICLRKEQVIGVEAKGIFSVIFNLRAP